ncbi:MAG: 30S ribosomal protein S6 [Actinomycetota bacterium]
MRPYETVLLLDARRDDAELEETITKFTALVTERGGEVAGVDRWGRRKLAYEIEDHTDGYYAVFTYSIEPSHRAEIEAALPFVDGIVRAKTVRRDVRTRGV